VPSRSKKPDSVVARDLSMDIKRRGESSAFVRVAVGLYTLRELAPDVESVVVDRWRRRWRWTQEARENEVKRRALKREIERPTRRR
jgi:hypothetical protein